MQLLGTSKLLKDVSSWNAEICAPKLAVWKVMNWLTQADVRVVFSEQLSFTFDNTPIPCMVFGCQLIICKVLGLHLQFKYIKIHIK